MIKKQTVILLTIPAVIVTVFAIAAVVKVDILSEKKEALKGIRSLSVVIEEFKPDFEKDGFLGNTIQSDVELKLRTAGITVVSDPDNPPDDYRREGSPSLHINLQTLKFDSRQYAYYLLIELHQPAVFIRNKKICYARTTWDISSAGSYGTDRLSEIRDITNSLVDKFINDCTEMNPKV